MSGEDRRWAISVPTDGDTLRQERLTVDLLEALGGSEAYSVTFTEEQVATDAGSKGSGVADVALWASIAAASRPAAQVLITAIKEWCAVRRERSLEVNVSADGGHSVTVTGSPTPTQERLLHEFLDKVAPEDATTNGPDEDEAS